MERSILMLMLAALLACGSASPSAASPTSRAGAKVPPPHMTPQVRRLLSAMGGASTFGHPDLWGEFTGMRHLFAGEYAEALARFRFAARYGDKLSQVTLGMMYLKGRGVDSDPAMACAWLTLGAGRGFPKYVLMRSRVCGALAPGQRQRARRVLARLRPVYGDTIAKRRMKLALQRAKDALTGSHIGFNFGVLSYTPGGGFSNPNCASPALHVGGVAVPHEGCGFHYDPRLWDVNRYFVARQQSLLPHVDVGPVKQVRVPPKPTRH